MDADTAAIDTTVLPTQRDTSWRKRAVLLAIASIALAPVGAGATFLILVFAATIIGFVPAIITLIAAVSGGVYALWRWA